MSSLNIALSKLFYTHVSVYTFSSSITSIFYSSTYPLYLGNLINFSYMKDTSSCSIFKLKAALGHLYVVLTIQGFIPVFAYYPYSIIILCDYYLCLPSLIQFLVTLVICWRIQCLPHHHTFSHQYLLKTKTYSFTMVP